MGNNNKEISRTNRQNLPHMISYSESRTMDSDDFTTILVNMEIYGDEAGEELVEYLRKLIDTRIN